MIDIDALCADMVEHFAANNIRLIDINYQIVEPDDPDYVEQPEDTLAHVEQKALLLDDTQEISEQPE